jgi:biotin transporter BioY
VQRQRLGMWIILAMVAFATLGAFLGSHLGGGNVGMIVLIGATLGVLGSFVPTSVTWLRRRARRAAGPGQAS